MLLILRLPALLIYFLLIAFLGTLICLFRPFNPANTPLCGWLFSVGGLKILGVKLVVEGREHFEHWQPGIVIANHQSNLDLFIFGQILPPRTVSVGKSSLKYLPLFGQVYWLAGNILINRRKKTQSIAAMTAISEAIHRNNSSVWVFPEGTRNPSKTLLPFKKGAFYMALNAQVPIVSICASAYSLHLNLNRWHACTVRVRIRPPIVTEGLGKEDLGPLMEKVQFDMQECCDALNQLVEDSTTPA